MRLLDSLAQADIEHAVQLAVRFGVLCREPQIKDYYQRFSGTSRPFRISRAGCGRFRVTLPNSRSFTIGLDPASDVSWSGELGRDTPSTRLWINSLEYLQLLPDDDSGLQVVEAVIESLRAFIEAEVLMERPKRGSFDHEVALQLRTCCILLARSGPNNRAQVRAILDPLVQLCIEMAERHDLFSTNNHGVMLAINVLRASLLFPSYGHRDSIVERSLRMLIASFSKSVSDDGVVSENTPEYQSFWIDLLEEIVNLFSWAGMHCKVTIAFRQMRADLSRAFEVMLLPDGSVPPLGDSSGGPQSRRQASPGTLISPENGLAIVSDSSTFMSFVCGARGVIHKQLDDASIFLWHKGYPLLTDAGLLDYDQTNKKSVLIRGQLGHSAAQYRMHDSLNAVKVCNFGMNTRRVRSSLVDLSTGSEFVFEGNVQIKNGPQVRRTVTMGESKFVRICDVFSDSNGSGPVSRFLLVPGSAPVLSAAHVSFTRGPEGSYVWGVLSTCLPQECASTPWSVESASVVSNRILRDDAYRVYVEPVADKGSACVQIGFSFGDHDERLACHHCGWTP